MHAGWAGRIGRAAYVHAHNGFYLGALQNRLVQRLWPVREPAGEKGGLR
jgi:hypothetical protein